jgi:mannosyltransferase OCH1-like enzyme
MTEEEIDAFEDYDLRAEATLAYRLMKHLAFKGIISDIDVSNLRWPPCELIVDAEEARDEQ